MAFTEDSKGNLLGAGRWLEDTDLRESLGFEICKVANELFFIDVAQSEGFVQGLIQFLDFLRNNRSGLRLLDGRLLLLDSPDEILRAIFGLDEVLGRSGWHPNYLELVLVLRLRLLVVLRALVEHSILIDQAIKLFHFLQLDALGAEPSNLSLSLRIDERVLLKEDFSGGISDEVVEQSLDDGDSVVDLAVLVQLRDVRLSKHLVVLVQFVVLAPELTNRLLQLANVF
mmetsp:Transcript_15880/g.24451  ORF Transcript_15880/g.24451 Transcript_15880/m.24451 type:complete len:228 (-) Transcript_15880:1744-2427(-)